ncbi:hypothetical protein Nepgr_011143, partial [Nepenthes gracilis]
SIWSGIVTKRRKLSYSIYLDFIVSALFHDHQYTVEICRLLFEVATCNSLIALWMQMKPNAQKNVQIFMISGPFFCSQPSIDYPATEIKGYRSMMRSDVNRFYDPEAGPMHDSSSH